MGSQPAASCTLKFLLIPLVGKNDAYRCDTMVVHDGEARAGMVRLDGAFFLQPMSLSKSQKVSIASPSSYTVAREPIPVASSRAVYTYSRGILVVPCRDFKRSRSPCLHIAHSECRRLPSVMVLPAISNRPVASTSPWNSEPFRRQSR